MKKRKSIRYITIGLTAAVAGLIVTALAVNTETDATIQQADSFINVHESKKYARCEPETVSLSYEEWKEQQNPVITPEEFMEQGVIFQNGWKYTWYSEQVLPGDGLKIPGRWSDGDFVRDKHGNLCVACNDLPKGTYVQTPFGAAVVYDTVGLDENGEMVHGVCDLYVSW